MHRTALIALSLAALAGCAVDDSNQAAHVDLDASLADIEFDAPAATGEIEALGLRACPAIADGVCVENKAAACEALACDDTCVMTLSVPPEAHCLALDSLQPPSGPIVTTDAPKRDLFVGSWVANDCAGGGPDRLELMADGTYFSGHAARPQHPIAGVWSSAGGVASLRPDIDDSPSELIFVFGLQEGGLAVLDDYSNACLYLPID